MVIAECIDQRPESAHYGKAWPSRTYLAERSGMAKNAVDEALNAIRRRGWLTTQKLFGGPLVFTLAKPEKHQSRLRAVNCKSASFSDSLGYVPDQVSGTYPGTVSGTGPKHKYNHQSKYQTKAEALEEKGSSIEGVRAQVPREVGLDTELARFERHLKVDLDHIALNRMRYRLEQLTHNIETGTPNHQRAEELLEDLLGRLVHAA